MKWKILHPSFYNCLFLSVLFLTFFGFPAQAAVPLEVVSGLTQSRVLDAPLELQLTSESSPLAPGVEVALNHTDAWLVFKEIKPSEVVENYLGQVKVNGAPFREGINGRIAIYAHGTVLIPHSPSFSPLTVFTAANFEGQQRSFELHTHHRQLDEFNNAIRSFKLKRGYQATFASNADGSGYSRVFIADKEDLEFAVMPELLDGSISFIRVFKHQWVTKKGWAGWDWNEYQMVNATWYYDWNADGSTSHNLEYALIKQHGHWPSWDVINNKTDVSNLLGFNEPDRPDQSNLTFDQALSMWPQYMASGLRLGSPATADPFNSWSLFNFIDRCDELNYRVDFVAIHAYWAKSPQQWYNDLKYIHDRTGRPIWITEWNNGANWTNEWWPDDPSTYTEANAQKQLNDLMAILNVLDTTSFVERYSIYNWVEDARAIVLNGQLTPAGEYYASNKSKVAYNSKFDVVPGYTYKEPTLSISHHRSTNSMRLVWDNPNGDLVRAFRLERSINGGDFESIYESNSPSNLLYMDPVSDAIDGAIRYRLGIETMEDTWLYSNMVVYMKTSGAGGIEGGFFPFDNSEWTQVIFSEPQSKAPLAFLGVPGFKSAMPLASRIGSVNTHGLQYRVQPWNYVRNPNFVGGDSLAVLTLPEGTYNFGGLKGEVGQVGRVKRDWYAVEFEQAFTQPPIVFVTQASNASTFPITLSIQNVGTNGFEVRLKSEEGVTAATLGEMVSYLAIEQGSGAVGSFRVHTGQTGAAGAVGTESLKIGYDAGFSKPVLFGSLLTDNNEFASNLRCYPTQETPEFTLFRQREFSGGAGVVKADEVGWMIVDLAEGQSVSLLPDIPSSSTGMFFPNPVKDWLYFDAGVPAEIRVYNMSGVMVLHKVVNGSLDVSGLKPGVYLVRMGELSHRMIKL